MSQSAPLRCPFYAGTMSFGSIKATDRITARSLSSQDLYLEAFNRGLDTTLSLSDICSLLQSQIPDIEWQRQMLYWHSTLTSGEQDTINSYTSYGYNRMNDSLRMYPDQEAEMNAIIDKAPPLLNDIVVYRYISEVSQLPDEGLVVHNGYLSTTFLASLVARASCEDDRKKLAVMRIVVPKGVRCIYVPSYEYELIFSHKTQLMVLGKSSEEMVCSVDNDTKDEITTVPIYQVEMLK